MREGQSPSFSTGYLLVGCLVSLLLGLSATTRLYESISASIYLFNGVVLHWNYDPITDLVFMTMWTLPQIALGLIGGLLAKRYGLTLTPKGRAAQADGNAS